MCIACRIWCQFAAVSVLLRCLFVFDDCTRSGRSKLCDSNVDLSIQDENALYVHNALFILGYFSSVQASFFAKAAFTCNPIFQWCKCHGRIIVQGQHRRNRQWSGQHDRPLKGSCGAHSPFLTPFESMPLAYESNLFASWKNIACDWGGRSGDGRSACVLLICSLA
jgi:hypothetical protein